MIKILIYDKYTEEYYNVIPVKKVEEKIEELKDMKVDGEVFTTAVNFAIINLQQLIKENTEEE